jgi:hypothetical protein
VLNHVRKSSLFELVCPRYTCDSDVIILTEAPKISP